MSFDNIEQTVLNLDVAMHSKMIGKHYKHYKGGTYIVKGITVSTIDRSILVRYSRVDGPGYNWSLEKEIEWSRPVREWFDTILDENENAIGSRFTEIDLSEEVSKRVLINTIEQLLYDIN